MRDRSVGEEALKQLAIWMDKNPTVPFDDWYKRFPTFTVCGEGQLVKTFLTVEQTATGMEVD